MPKTNIKDILKRGEATVVVTVNYSDPTKKRELKLLRERTDKKLSDSKRVIADFFICI